VEEPGFHRVATSLIAVGAKYGAIFAAEILPCSTTVSRHMGTVVELNMKRKHSLQLEQVLVFGITTEM
jgi:hypothetical protein